MLRGVYSAPVDAREAIKANRQLIRALVRHHVPVTGFVVQKSVETLEQDSGPAILGDWIKHGLDLGNHTYAHPDFDHLTVEQFEGQIVRGEAAFLPLMTAAGAILPNSSVFQPTIREDTGDGRDEHASDS